MSRIITDSPPKFRPFPITRNSQPSLWDDGITYNQAGVSYNDVLYSYGGVYGYLDFQPIVSLVANPTPRISGYADIYVHPVPPGQNSGMLIGILGMTYP